MVSNLSGCHCRKPRLGDGSFVKEVVKADWIRESVWRQVGVFITCHLFTGYLPRNPDMKNNFWKNILQAQGTSCQQFKVPPHPASPTPFIMPIIGPAATAPLAPQQHKQPSRKGKKAWRKNVDVTEIQEGLEEVRDEITKGLVTRLEN
jgi:hypothetical protein